MLDWEFIGQLFLKIIIIYGLITVLVYFTADFAMYPVPKASYRDTAQILKLSTSDGRKISAVYLENPNAKYTVLFSHGNGEDLGFLMPFLQSYREHGFSILAYDYHGYGTSEGRPSEKNTYLDIAAAYDYLTTQLKVAPHHIILHGRSLGSGPSLELASLFPVSGIILESPFLTAFRVVTKIPLFPIDKYRNNQKITRVKAPILVIHGMKDEVIPFWQGKKLYEMANEPKQFLPLENAGHNDITEVSGNLYWQAIEQFSKTLKE